MEDNQKLLFPEQETKKDETKIKVNQDIQTSLIGIPSEKNIKPEKNEIHPIIPVVVNIFLPGFGHFFIRQNKKALFYFCVSILCYVFISIITFISFGITSILNVFPLIYQVFIAMDSYFLSEKLRQGISIGEFECTNSVAEIGMKWLSELKFECNCCQNQQTKK